MRRQALFALVTAARSRRRSAAQNKKVTTRFALALTGLVMASIVLAGCGSGKSNNSGSSNQSGARDRHYTLASIESCWFGDGTDEYAPSDRRNGNEDLDVAVSWPLANAAYTTGQGAFVTLVFPSSTGHGAAFYGFSTAQAAAAAMTKYRQAILTAALPSDTASPTPTVDEVWRSGNIIVVGVPSKLPSVEANKLDSCFGGAHRRVALPSSS
jgi:hypothetical protein